MDFSGLPSFDEIMGVMEQYNITPEFMDALMNFVMLTQLQNQAGQQQLGMAQTNLGLEQVGLGREQVGLQRDQLAFERDFQLPFQREQLENQRILAELGLEGKELDLQSQRELAAIRRQQEQMQLAQLQERGTHDTLMQAMGLQTARINLAAQREQAAQVVRGQRGSGEFTPRTVAF